MNSKAAIRKPVENGLVKAYQPITNSFSNNHTGGMFQSTAHGGENQGHRAEPRETCSGFGSNLLYNPLSEVLADKLHLQAGGNLV
jgi:hypothetical protein